MQVLNLSPRPEEGKDLLHRETDELSGLTHGSLRPKHSEPNPDREHRTCKSRTIRKATSLKDKAFSLVVCRQPQTCRGTLSPARTAFFAELGSPQLVIVEHRFGEVGISPTLIPACLDPSTSCT